MFDKSADADSHISESLRLMCGEEPARDLLFREHAMLLRSGQMSGLVNRILLIIIVLLDIVFASQSTRMNVAFFVVGLVTALLWYLQNGFVRQSVNRLEELIIETYTERLDDDEQSEREIHLKPVKTSNEVPSKRMKQKETWITTYINWRHDRWKHSRYELAQKLEPPAWLLILISVTLSRLFFG